MAYNSEEIAAMEALLLGSGSESSGSDSENFDSGNENSSQKKKFETKIVKRDGGDSEEQLKDVDIESEDELAFEQDWKTIFPEYTVVDDESVDTVRKLIDYLIDHPDKKIKSQLWQQSGDTPLHRAIKRGNDGLALALIPFYPIEAFKAQDSQGNTVLHLAAFFRMKKLLRRIEQRVNELETSKKKYHWNLCLIQKNGQGLTPQDCYEAAQKYAEFVDGKKEPEKEEEPGKKKNRFQDLLYNTLSVKPTDTKKDEFKQEEIVKQRDWNPLDALLLQVNKEELQQSLSWLLNQGEIPSEYNEDHEGSSSESSSDEDDESHKETKTQKDTWTINLPVTDENIAELMSRAIAEIHKGKEDPLKTAVITNYFSSGKLLEKTQDFIEKLDTVSDDLRENHDDNEGINAAANHLKNAVYKAILEKQEARREKRWKLAGKLSLVGLLLPGISHAIIWGWYLYERVKEPLRSKEISANTFVDLYDKKEKGFTAKNMLDALHQKAPVNEDHKARKAFIQAEVQEYEADSEDSKEVYDFDDSEKVSLLATVLIISTNWNKQAKHFADKVREHDKNPKESRFVDTL